MSDALLFASVPGFYAELERAADPALAERPVIVGGNPRKRGVVQAATPDATARGVVQGMSVLEALSQCPRARAVPTDMRRYREATQRLLACFRRASERVEPAEPGAAWLEPPGGSDPEALAAALREQAEAELGVPLCVGIAPSKFLARLAAEEAGAPGVRRVRAGEVADFLGPLAVTRLPGVGPKTAATLAEMGVGTAAEAVAAGRAALEARLGNHGLSIFDHAQGRDAARLRPAPHARSLSQQTTLEHPERDLAVLEERLTTLAAGLAGALERERLAAGRVVLLIDFADGQGTTRTRTLPAPAHAAAELARVSAELLARTQAGERPVRRVALAVRGLARRGRDDRQLDLFAPER